MNTSMFSRFQLASIMFLLAGWAVCAQTHNDGAVWQFRIDSAVIKDNVRQGLRGNLYVSTPLETERILSVTGENDVIKIMGLKPGVSSGVEGTNAFFVRGSGSSGARIEMNGVALTRSSHLLGLVSSVPSEMVKSISFAPGGQSSTSGNFTSALIKIDLKDALVKQKREAISVSPYMASYYIESAPTNSLTTRVSARGSLAPVLANSLFKLFKIDKNNATTQGGAYDVVFSGDWHPSDVLKLKGLVYRTQDIFNYSFGLNKTWLNSDETIAKVGGKWYTGDKLSLNADVAVAVSEELHKEEFRRNTDYSGKVQTGLLSLKDQTIEYSGKLWMHYLATDKLTFDAGADISRREFKFVSHKKNYSAEGSVPKGIGTYTNYRLLSLFGESFYEIEKTVKVKGGFRWNSYLNQGGNQTHSIDIHILADFFIKNDFGLEITYDRNSQFHHVLDGLPSGWGQDVILASGDRYPYEKSHQLYAGLFGEKQLSDKARLSLSAGVYTKDMSDLISYVHSSHVFGVVDHLYDSDFVSGTGQSRGIEMNVKLKTPRLLVDASYTYSSSKRKFPGINWDKEFHFRFERPHMFNLSGDYEISRKKTESGYTLTKRANVTAIVTSGHLMTMTQGRFLSIIPGTTRIYGDNIIRVISPIEPQPSFIEHEESENITSHEDLSELNNFRLPMYFRVDAGFSWSWDKGGKGYDLFVSVVNLLNRSNPYQYFYEDEKWKQLSILPFMPTARFAWRF